MSALLLLQRSGDDAPSEEDDLQTSGGACYLESMFEKTEWETRASAAARPLVALIAVAGACSVLGCAAPALPTEQDWTTTYRGSGNVPCRLVNDYQFPITLRIKDFHDNIDAQVTLQAGRAEIVYLPPGPVRAIVHAEQKGVPGESQGQLFNVPASTIGVDWRFFPSER